MSYFVYVDGEVAERFIGKDLKMMAEENAIVLRVVNRASVTKTGIETPFLHQSPRERQRTLSART